MRAINEVKFTTVVKDRSPILDIMKPEFSGQFNRLNDSDNLARCVNLLRGSIMNSNERYIYQRASKSSGPPSQ
jgi:hypothetical protein